jgi:hypothetical protein
VSDLEAAYRGAMRWYPARWRAANAEALVSLMVEFAEGEGRSAPTRADLRNLQLNGLRARVAFIERIFPARARERASSLALGIGLGMAVTVLVVQEWAPWAAVPTGALAPTGVGPFHGWGGVLYSAWCLAALLAIARLSTPARILIAATVPFSVVLVAVGPYNDGWFRPTATGLAILGGFALVAALGRPVTGARSYLALGAATIVGVGLVLFPFTRNVHFDSVIPPTWMWSIILHGNSGSTAVLASVAILVAVGLVVRDPQWIASLALLAAPGLAVVLVSLTVTSPEVVVLFGGLLLILAAVAVVVVLRLRGLRIALIPRP